MGILKINPRYLSPDEERKLFAKFHDEGCQESRRILIESVIPFAVQQAHKMRNYRNENDSEELVSCAMVACVKAVDRFDVTRGTRLITTIPYAVRGALNDRIEGGAIYVPSYKRYSDDAMEITANICSLDHEYQSDDDSNGYHLDLCQPDSTVMLDDGDEFDHRYDLVRAAMKSLTKKEREVIQRRYFDQQTLREAGDAMGLTRERVRQIQLKAIEHLQKVIKVK